MDARATENKPSLSFSKLHELRRSRRVAIASGQSWEDNYGLQWAIIKEYAALQGLGRHQEVLLLCCWGESAGHICGWEHGWEAGQPIIAGYAWSVGRVRVRLLWHPKSACTNEKA